MYIFLYYVLLYKEYFIAGWKYLAFSMSCIATAMLCKEQGITVAGVCAAYEIFVAQKVYNEINFKLCVFC